MRWITAWQIKHEQFRTRRWREGYDMNEVDAFLDDLIVSTNSMQDHIADQADHIFNLEARIHELEGRLRWGREPLRETRVDPPSEPVTHVPPSLAAQYKELEAATAAPDVPRQGPLEVLRPDEPAVSSGVSAVSPGPGHPVGDDLADELAAEAETHLRRHYESHDEWTMRLALESAQWQADARLRLAAA